jgi:hypothetical protein
MKTLFLTAATLAATAAVATSAQSATVVATLTGQAPYGGLYLGFGPSTASGVALKAQGKELLTFAAGGAGSLVAADFITGSTSTAASVSGTVFTQGGFSGSYEEDYYGVPASTVVDSVSLSHAPGPAYQGGGTDLLSGTFTNGTVTVDSSTGKGTFQFDATYTTPFADTGAPATGHFIDHFTVYNGIIQLQGTGFIHSFNANSQDGTYFGAVPEPAAWALMLVGFGGIGVAMRRRKAVAAA